jgi:hypothetical protein
VVHVEARRRTWPSARAQAAIPGAAPVAGEVEWIADGSTTTA